jgi:hypothetical protein
LLSHAEGETSFARLLFQHLQDSGRLQEHMLGNRSAFVLRALAENPEIGKTVQAQLVPLLSGDKVPEKLGARLLAEVRQRGKEGTDDPNLSSPFKAPAHRQEGRLQKEEQRGARGG